jgi:hypothetical protein
MRSGMRVAGGLLVAFGVLFTLQGVGKVQGSFMSNTTTWTVLGPIIALIGLGLVIVGQRRRRECNVSDGRAKALAPAPHAIRHRSHAACRDVPEISAT